MWNAGPGSREQGPTTRLGWHFPGLRVGGRRGRLWLLGHPQLMVPDSQSLGVKLPSSPPTNYLEVFQSPSPACDFFGALGWVG